MISAWSTGQSLGRAQQIIAEKGEEGLVEQGGLKSSVMVVLV